MNKRHVIILRIAAGIVLAGLLTQAGWAAAAPVAHQQAPIAPGRLELAARVLADDDPPGGDETGDTGDPPGGEETGDASDGGDSPGGIAGAVSRIFHVIRFPVPTMVEALQKSLQELFKGSASTAASVFRGAATQALTGVYHKAPQRDVWEGPWNLVLTVSVTLWPITLALLVVATAQNTSLSGAAGWADLKVNLGEWVTAGVLAVGSLYLLSLFNGLADEVAWKLLETSVSGGVPEQAPLLLVGTVLNTGLLVTLLMMPGGIFLGLFYIILGFTVLTSLIGAYLARYALMYVLIVIAPLAISLGVLPPFRWIYAMWLKGYVVVALVGPVNALLIGLATHAAIESNVSIGTGNIAQYFINLVAVLGMLSLLIALDYELARATFGAAIAVFEQTQAAAKATLTVAAAAVTGLATGGIGLAAGGAAAGAGASGAGAGGAAAGAGETAAGAAGAGGASEAAGGAAAGGAGVQAGQANAGASAWRTALSKLAGQNDFDAGAGLSGAGSVMQYGSQGWLGRTAGAAMRSVGQALQAQDREERHEAAASAATEAGEERSAQQSQAWGQRMIDSDGARVLAGMGINPGTPEGQQMTGALTALGQRHGSGPTGMAARNAMLGLAAMPNAAGGEGARQMAQSLGFDNAGDMTRGLVGSELAARGQASRGDYPETGVDPRDLARLPASSSPTPQEYAYGGQMAANMRRLNPANAAAYAGLVHGVRTASPSPEAAAAHISYLATLPDQVRAGGVQDMQDVWARFGQQAEDYLGAHNLVPAQPHESWQAWEAELGQLKKA
ncbi:MAG: hypothetical protein JXM73_24290 [Anaerolineae bacterium]|nr:hypothetical protein [Anaerolineae bacterium]